MRREDECAVNTLSVDAEGLSCRLAVVNPVARFIAR
jgi:hypothetical protein